MLNREKYNFKTSISDIDDFKNICFLASVNDKVFYDFKRSPNFRSVLEHVSFELGLEYIEEIEKDPRFDTNKINKIKENDSQGNPFKFQYKKPYGLISPTTLRYLKVLNDLIIKFGSLDDFCVVEIGVGYGGQSKIIQDYFNIREYNFIDLFEVNQLTKKYLNPFGYKNNNFLNFENLPDKKYDLLISNYALTECDKKIQEYYYDKVIKKSEHGYITGNDIAWEYDIENFKMNDWLIKIKNSKTEPEKPQTDTEDRNYILTF